MNFILAYINILLLLLVLSISLYLLKSKASKVFIKRNYFILISIIFLALFYKYPQDNVFFQGLEYEDSYLANSVSRYLEYNQNNSEASFLANTCSIGSLSECDVSSSHPGNLIGLPAITWLINEVIGYDAKNLSVINLLFSIVTALLIYIVCYKICRKRFVGLIASLVYITTPILNSFHTSTLFETSSSSLILFSLLIFIMYFEKNRNEKTRIYLFLLLIVINIFSLHFKRENIIIISFPFILFFIHLLQNKKILTAKLYELLPYLIFLVGLVFYYLYVINIKESLVLEREYAIGNSFQFKFFFPLFMMFVRGFTNFNWFYFYIIFTLIGLIIIILNRKREPLLFYPMVLFLAFILVNSIHHRSYYFVRTWEVAPFESLRHINMLSPYYAIVTGYGIHGVIKFFKERVKLRRNLKWLVMVLVVATMGHLFSLSKNTRKELVDMEQHNRIMPIMALISATELENNLQDIVITDQSILLHNYCDPNLLIIEFTQLGEYFSPEDINGLLNRFNIHFLWKDYFKESIFIERYQDSFDVLESLKLKSVEKGDGYEVLKLY